MILSEIISLADSARPNTFTNAQKVGWINTLEADIQTNIWLRAPERCEAYVWQEDTDAEMLAPSPFDTMYVHWLCAQISLARGEFEDYRNSAALFDSVYGEYTRWFSRTYRPANMRPDERERIYSRRSVPRGDTFKVRFERVPFRSDDARGVQVLLKHHGEQIICYSGAAEEIEYEDRTVTLTVPAADSAKLPRGLLRVYLKLTGPGGESWTSSPPETVRITAG